MFERVGLEELLAKINVRLPSEEELEKLRGANLDQMLRQILDPDLDQDR